MIYNYEISYYLHGHSDTWILFTSIVIILSLVFISLFYAAFLYFKGYQFNIFDIIGSMREWIKAAAITLIILGLLGIGIGIYKSCVEDYQVKIGNASVVVNNEIKRELSRLNLETISIAYPITSKEQVEVILENILGKDIEVK